MEPLEKEENRRLGEAKEEWGGGKGEEGNIGKEKQNDMEACLLSLEPLERKEKERRRKRAAKFGTEFDESAEVHVDLEDIRVQLRNGTPERRRDVRPSGAAELLRESTLHVYGVRMMSSAQVLEIFRGHGVGSIEWVNNDSCNIVFDNAFACKRAMLALGKLESDADMEAAGDQPAGTKPASGLAPWHTLKASVSAAAGGVSFRLAMVADRKPFLAEILHSLGKLDGPASQFKERGSAAPSSGDSWGKRARGSSDGALRMIQDLDAPIQASSGPSLVSPLLPYSIPAAVAATGAAAVSAWPLAGTLGPARDVLETGDLREKLRKSEGDLRERLRQKGRERVEEEEGVEDLRRVIDRQRRARRPAGSGEGTRKSAGGRMFLQSIACLQPVNSEKR